MIQIGLLRFYLYAKLANSYNGYLVEEGPAERCLKLIDLSQSLDELSKFGYSKSRRIFESGEVMFG